MARGLCVLLVAYCCFLSISVSSAESVQILFLENSALEHAWTFRVDLGREAVSKTFYNQVLTSVEITDEFDDEATTRLVDQYVAKGFKIFFMTSSGFANAVQVLALRYPDVYFVQVPGSDYNLPNVLGINSALYQAYYLAGLLAGDMTVSKKIGFLNGVDGVATTLSCINAYCIGAQVVDPTITCHQIVLGDWIDERKHTQATDQLLNAGCDHIVSMTGSYIPNEIAASRFAAGQDVYSVGFADDFRVKVGESVATSAVNYWNVNFVEIVSNYLAGTPLSGLNYASMANRGVDVAPPSDVVPASARPFFFSERSLLQNSTSELVFCGGAALAGLPADIVVGTDGCLSIEQIANMDYQLDYVETTEPIFYYNDIYVTKGSATFIGMMVAISVAVVIGLFFLVLLFIYLKTPVIRFASPVFCIVIFFGAFLQFAAAYLYLQPPTDAICMAPYWLEMVGLVMMLSAILVKNYRMWRVVQSAQKFVAIQISTAELMVAIALAIAGMLVILIVWQTTDPYEKVYESAPELAIDERYLLCGNTDQALWIGLTWGYQCVWIFAGVILAYLTRRLQGVFNESSGIALTLYNVIVLELICLPLIYTFNLNQYQARTILLTLQPSYRAIATLTLIFGPKFWIAWRHPHKNIMPSSLTSRSRGATNASSTTNSPTTTG